MDAPFLIRPLSPAGNPPPQAGTHRHGYQEVIIITRGEGFHRIDWEDHHLAGPHAVLVAQGKLHLFRVAPGSRGWVIDFAPAFLPPNASWVFSHFFALSAVPLDDPAGLGRIEALCGLLAEQGAQDGGGGETVGYLLAALLSLLDTRVQDRALRGRPERRGDFHMVKHFLGVLDSHYQTEKKLDFYARHLRINPRRLTSVCKQIMGRTPASLLEERCMVEARRFLAQSDLTVQQIALRLGYEDQSYFTKVFRKVVNDTPARFRAAWAGPGQ